MNIKHLSSRMANAQISMTNPGAPGPNDQRAWIGHWALGIGILLVIGAWSLVARAQAAEPATAVAITQPSKKSAAGFREPGVVREVKVKEGQEVKQGELLVQLDDGTDRKLLEALELEANSRIRVEAAEADLSAKQVKLTRVKAGHANNAFADSELEEAELEVLFRTKQIGLAELEWAKAKIEAERQAIKVANMQLLSPFNGVIDKIEVHEGEVADPQKPAITIVQNDPLKVEIHLPTTQAARLKFGDKLEVRYYDEKEWAAADVTFLKPVADAASDTREVHLSLPNPSGRHSGLQVFVKIPDRLLAAAGQ